MVFPYTGKSAPVTARAAGEQRKATTSATSSASNVRLGGQSLAAASAFFGSFSTAPGQTALTRMRCSLRSWASAKVKPLTPNFVATCGATFCREPGFFLGSIYFNYGATVVVATIVWFLTGGTSRPVSFASFAPFAVFCAVFPLWFLRYARSLFAALDQFFDPREIPPRPEDQSST